MCTSVLFDNWRTSGGFFVVSHSLLGLKYTKAVDARVAMHLHCCCTSSAFVCIRLRLLYKLKSLVNALSDSMIVLQWSLSSFVQFWCHWRHVERLASAGIHSVTVSSVHQVSLLHFHVSYNSKQCGALCSFSAIVDLLVLICSPLSVSTENS